MKGNWMIDGDDGQNGFSPKYNKDTDNQEWEKFVEKRQNMNKNTGIIKADLTLGQSVVLLRQQAGLGQKELATKAHVSLSQLCNLEKDSLRANPSKKWLEKIAKPIKGRVIMIGKSDKNLLIVAQGIKEIDDIRSMLNTLQKTLTDLNNEKAKD